MFIKIGAWVGLYFVLLCFVLFGCVCMCNMCVVRLKIVLRFVFCMYDCYVQFFFRWHSYTLFDCSWKTDERIGATVNLYTKFSHGNGSLTSEKLSEKTALPHRWLPSNHFQFEWIFHNEHAQRHTHGDFDSSSNQTINNALCMFHVRCTCFR